MNLQNLCATDLSSPAACTNIPNSFTRIALLPCNSQKKGNIIQVRMELTSILISKALYLTYWENAARVMAEMTKLLSRNQIFSSKLLRPNRILIHKRNPIAVSNFYLQNFTTGPHEQTPSQNLAQTSYLH